MQKAKLKCPFCGSEDVDWSWRDKKYGCYYCGKMFTKKETDMLECKK